MNKVQIPYNWLDYRNNPAYFVSYFGDIYFGRLIELLEYEDGIFIVQNDKLQTIRDEKTENNIIELYKKYAWEINDINIIKEVIPERIFRDTKFKELSFSNQQFKRTFVFGAAASSFCVFGDNKKDFRNSKLNPPTGFELFDEKYDDFIKKYQGAETTVPLFESMDKDIEACLNEEWEEYKSSYNKQVAIRHINIQYYMQDLFRNISDNVVNNYSRKNLYSLFLNKIQKELSKNSNEIISLISFNYDTILDQYISKIFNYSLDNIDDYTDYNNRNLLLFKPHGSCDWGWKLKDNFFKNVTGQEGVAKALYKNNIEPWELYYKIIGNYKDVVARNSWGIEYSNDKNHRGKFTLNKNLIEKIDKKSNNLYLPSLLLPYRDKDEMVMPYNHSRVMRNSIENTEELFLIGWKGNEDLFNRWLSRASRIKKIVVVNPDATTVKNNLKQYINLDNITIDIIDDFETFVLNDLDKYLKN